MRRCDHRDVPRFAPQELRLFIVVRNEGLRLPYLLRYYFERGVDRLFAVDNDSTDHTRSLLLEQRANVARKYSAYDDNLHEEPRLSLHHHGAS